MELSLPPEQTVANPVVSPVVSPVGYPERQPAAIAGNEPLTPAIQPRPVSPAQPRINPASPSAFGEPSNPRARGAEAPTIQVTIGRIEVRATPPPAPVPKPRPASPTMSLDDYLRQRNEGRR